MNFAAFNFLGMPRGFIATLVAFTFLAQAGALATNAQTGPCAAVATPLHGAREGQVKSSAAVMTAECVCYPRRLGVGGAGLIFPINETHAAQGACKRAAMAVSAATRNQEPARV